MQEQKHLPVSGPRHPILPVSGSGALMNYLGLPSLPLEPLESSGVTQGKEKGCQGSKGGNQKEPEPRFPGMGAFMELVATVGLMPFFPCLSTRMSLLALLSKDDRITAWWGLEGTPGDPPAQPPAQAGSPRAGCTAPRPAGVGTSPEKETPQPLWAAWARAPSRSK